MKNLKKYIGIMAILVMSLSLSGCSLGFDASAYVKACLDACTKGEVTEYARITNTSEEAVKDTYHNMIEADLKVLDSYQISEEKKEAFRTLYQTMYKSLRYEVGEATKNSDGSFTVPVTTKKMIVFDTIIVDSENYIKDYAKTHRSVSTAELSEAVLDYMYTQLSDNLKSANYQDSQVITIQVSKTTNNQYGISESDLQNLIFSMIDAENIQ